MAGAAVLAVLGAGLITLALVRGHGPPAPASAPQTNVRTDELRQPQAHPPSPDRPTPRVLPRSVPVHIRIPAIKVSSSLLKLGLTRDGEVEVPPYSLSDEAGWYRYSPTPGQPGPSVIVGHVDSQSYGPGVFYRLGRLKAGDLVRIRRADRSVAVFTVNRVVDVPKKHFPTNVVYGRIDHPGLRLITCGGDYRASEGGYQDNTVVFASLTGIKRA